MWILPSHTELLNRLNSYDFDIGKCVNYFLEELQFEWVVIYRDRPGFSVAPHSHEVDDYTYILDWELRIMIDGVEHILKKWDFFFFPKGVIHRVLPGSGAKYLVATENADFEAHFIEV